MLDSGIPYETKETDRRECDLPTDLRSHLGPGVCQMCGATFGLYQVDRDMMIIRSRLDDSEVAFRHHTDPHDADFIWLPCPMCKTNLDGFHTMGEAEYKEWLNGYPSAWDDRPERTL